jgi:hypothetical protein
VTSDSPYVRLSWRAEGGYQVRVFPRNFRSGRNRASGMPGSAIGSVADSWGEAVEPVAPRHLPSVGLAIANDGGATSTVRSRGSGLSGRPAAWPSVTASMPAFGFGRCVPARIVGAERYTPGHPEIP